MGWRLESHPWLPSAWIVIHAPANEPLRAGVDEESLLRGQGMATWPPVRSPHDGGTVLLHYRGRAGPEHRRIRFADRMAPDRSSHLGCGQPVAVEDDRPGVFHDRLPCTGSHPGLLVNRRYPGNYSVRGRRHLGLDPGRGMDQPAPRSDHMAAQVVLDVLHDL